MDCCNFENTVKQYIETHHILSDDGNVVIVGLSGGADSVALLSVLHHLGYTCKAVHCNFHLRGDESMRDQYHAEKIAESLGVSCEVVNFDTKTYMKQKGISLEMACRELRYDYFAKVVDYECAQGVAVAHHKDDNIETMFINLLRGTGLRGLRGMLPKQGLVLRPLLCVTRTDIEQYLSACGLTYVVDSTNAINDTARNKLRNILLPLLRREFPNADTAISNTIGILQSEEAIYTRAIDELCERYISDDGRSFDLCRMVAEQTSPETILFELVRKYGFNATQAADMIRSRSHSGSIFKTITHQALINRGFLEVLEMRPKNDGLSCDTGCDCIISDVTDASQWPMSCDVSLIDKCDFAPIKGDVSTLYLDAAVLDNSPVWKLRRWQKGDKLKPFGMDGTRKLSDIFSDAKLSLIEKQNIKVLERNGEIIWVVGMRASRLYPVLSTTSRVLKITVHK